MNARDIININATQAQKPKGLEQTDLKNLISKVHNVILKNRIKSKDSNDQLLDSNLVHDDLSNTNSKSLPIKPNGFSNTASV